MTGERNTSPLSVNSRQSFSSYQSSDDENHGSLYPSDADDLLTSHDSRRSTLWFQYSLINKSFQSHSQLDYCLCCTMSTFRHTALKIIFVLVVGFGLLISSITLCFSTFSTHKVRLTGGDQILIPTSTYFNRQVKISKSPAKKHRDNSEGRDGKIQYYKLDDVNMQIGKSHPIKNSTVKIQSVERKPYSTVQYNQMESLKLFVLPDLPRMSGKILSYSDGVKFHIPSWSYQYWGLHLLLGTDLMISVCSDLHLQFYIIKSDQKLQEWKETTLFYHFDYKSSIQPQQTCTKKQNFKSHLMKVKESDIYYLIFSSSVGWRFLTEVTVVLHFNRTFYDVENYKQMCSFQNQNSCIAHLNYASQDIVLLQAAVNLTNPKSSFYNNYELDFSPQPRVSFYIRLFGYLYMGIVVMTVLYTLWRFCVDAMTRRQYESITPEEQKLLHPEIYRPCSYSPRTSPGEMENETKKTPRKSTKRKRASTMKPGIAVTMDSSDGSEDFRPPQPQMPSRYPHRPPLSAMNGESIESLFKRSRDRVSRDEMMRIQRQFIEDQQILDSVMTSAGVSAI